MSELKQEIEHPEGGKLFDTDHEYAIVAGWLIIPALKIFLALVTL